MLALPGKRKQSPGSEESAQDCRILLEGLCKNHGIASASLEILETDRSPEMLEFGIDQFGKKNSGNHARCHEDKICQGVSSGVSSVLDLCTPSEVPDLLLPLLREEKRKSLRNARHLSSRVVGYEQRDFASTCSVPGPQSSLPPPRTNKAKKKKLKEPTGTDDTRFDSRDEKVICTVEKGLFHSSSSELRQLTTPPAGLKKATTKRKKSFGIESVGYPKDGSCAVENRISHVCEILSPLGTRKKMKRKKSSGMDCKGLHIDENGSYVVENGKSHDKTSDVSELMSYPSRRKKEKVKGMKTTLSNVTESHGYKDDICCVVDSGLFQGPEVRELRVHPSGTNSTTKEGKRFLGLSDNMGLQQTGISDTVEENNSSDVLKKRVRRKRRRENDDNGLKRDDGGKPAAVQCDSSMEILSCDDLAHLPDSTIPSSNQMCRRSSPYAAGQMSSVASGRNDSEGEVEGNYLQAPQPVMPPSTEPVKKKTVSFQVADEHIVVKKTVRFQVPDDHIVEKNKVSFQVSDEHILEKKTVAFQVPHEYILDENVSYIHTERDNEEFVMDEDETIKASVYNFVKSRGWGVNYGVQKVLQARSCWLDIAKCLPSRPVKQIHARARELFGAEKPAKWSHKDLDVLEELHGTHGHNWKQIGLLMGRSALLCQDKWRRSRLNTTRRSRWGTWTPDELEKLCTLVRRNLRVEQTVPPKKFDRRLQPRDDINWQWICGQMQRSDVQCANAWYDKLASPMIKEKKWANEDDRLLLQSLMVLGPASDEAVDWDSVLHHRDGHTCMERWTEMKRMLGTRDHVSFEDKLDILAERYAPDLLPTQADTEMC